ncbi:MAG: hypothetical protein QME68_08900, partial [Elusimicrobiota bacterium]|nr:hypothetical protein [Elusimicrobiota bacterium]
MSPKERIAQLDHKYKLICEEIKNRWYGEGGQIVLKVAYDALKWGYRKGKWDLIEIEDLWTEAIMEGGVLFNKPDKRWGPTGPAETLDMLGQTTIGPWQLTTTNIQNIYGLPYGIKKEWQVSQVIEYCRRHPEIQAKMIADYIQNSYKLYGVRSPYGIQNYFWLEAFVKGEIGQGKWYDSSLVKLKEGQTWEDITPEQKKQTGFYAKQILLGNPWEPHGMFYWFYITKDFDAIKQVLKTWKQQKKYVWDDSQNKAIVTEENGNFEITPEDIIFCNCHPKYKEAIKKL